MRLNAVKECCGLSRSSIYKYIQDGKFPKPIRLGERAVGWLESEIENFLSQRIELRGEK